MKNTKPGKIVCSNIKNKEKNNDLKKNKGGKFITYGRTSKWKNLYSKNIPVKDESSVSQSSFRLDNFWYGSLLVDTDLCITDGKFSVSPKFLNRQVKYFSSEKPKKSPKGGIPVGGFFNNKIYPLIQARYLYCRKYQSLVTKLPEFKELYDLRSNGQNIFITGFTGIDFEFLPNQNRKSVNDTLKTIFENLDYPLSNELILLCLLSDLFPWDYNKIDDNDEDEDDEDEDEDDEDEDEEDDDEDEDDDDSENND